MPSRKDTIFVGVWIKKVHCTNIMYNITVCMSSYHGNKGTVTFLKARVKLPWKHGHGHIKFCACENFTPLDPSLKRRASIILHDQSW